MTAFVSRLDDIAVHIAGWLDLPGGRAISRMPLWDNTAQLFARIGHGPAEGWAEAHGYRLATVAELDELHRAALHVEPYTLPTLPMLDAAGIPKPRFRPDGSDTPALASYRVANMRTRAWCEQHDAEVLSRLREAGWSGQPVANAGKHWAQDGLIYGWWRKGGSVIQGASAAHRVEPAYTDYATTVHVVLESSERPTKPELPPPPSMPPPPTPPNSDAGGAIGGVGLSTVRRGDTGGAVAAVQRIVGVTADGVFGPLTERAVRRWQAIHSLVSDGIWGPKSWRAAGFEVSAPPGDPRAPACLAALRDANARWPARSRASDGILGDSAHQASKSDHNSGNAVDITHDPGAGCSGDYLAEVAIADGRTTYVIWNRRIYNRARAAEGWRVYTGANGHTHHVHISVRVDRRDDASRWGWAPE